MVTSIYISSFRHTHVITYRKLWLNKRCNWPRQTVEMKCDTEQIMKLDWHYKVGSECELNWSPDSSVCSSLWKGFTGCWFHSNSVQLSKPTSKNSPVVNIIYISSFCYTHMITCRKLRLKKRGDWQRKTTKMKCDTEQMMKLKWL